MSPKTALYAAALVLAGAAGSAGLAQADPTPAAAPPGAVSFNLGSLELVALRDGKIDVPNDSKTFGVNANPAAVGAVLKAAGAPTDPIELSADALLVRDGDRIVLLDTGLGPKAHGALPQSLAQAGVKPDQVTDVLITHSHFDHIGGLLDANGRSAFPKATIRFSAKEWAWLKSQPDSKALVAAIGPQVKTFEPGATVAPGITSVAIRGHTPGHVGYEIVSGEARLLDIGDTAHSSIVSLARPDWVMQFDQDEQLGRTSREAELAKLAKSQELVFAPHFPFPGVGRIEAAGKGYAWKPTLQP